MNRVTIFGNAIDPKDHETFEVRSLCAFLKKRFTTFPDTARIYHDTVAASTDVTPHCEADIRRLQRLKGHFFVVVWPEDPITVAVITAIALSAISIGMSFLLRPSTPNANDNSPNNELQGRQNKARPNARIPDIFGTVRSTPDLLALPYKMFQANQEVEVSYMCIGRGAYTVLDCNDDQTPVNEIEGEYVAVYPPNNSPNSAAPAPQNVFGVAPSSIPKVVSVQQSNAINGQVCRSSNAGSLETDNNVAFGYGGTVNSNSSSLDFTDYFVASTPDVPSYLTIYTNDDGINASDPAQNVHSVGLAGTYQILSVSANQITLSNPASVNANWNTLAQFSGQMSTYYHTFAITSATSLALGPYILNVANMTEVWANFVGTNGLYYVDSDGNQHALTVTIQVTAQSINSAMQTVGTPVTQTVNLTGSSLDNRVCGSTIKLTLPTPGPCQVSVQRITPTFIYHSNKAQMDQVQWRDLFAVAPVDFGGGSTTGDFGNVTTVLAITAQTPDALSVKQRKLNLLVTRNLPTWINRTQAGAPQFSVALAPTNNAADIFCAMALDPYIGRRQLTELDVPGIYGVADVAYLKGEHTDGAISQYFGSFLMAEFCYTFDDAAQSFEQMAAYLAQAINCIAYRSARTISLSFEQQNSASTLLYNHRNKIPGSEKRTVTFGTLNNNNGVYYDYVDPNAPNFPDQEISLTLYLPSSESATTPKRVKSIGVRNLVQATINSWRLYQKIVYGAIQTEFEATQEANLNILSDRILVADNTRTGTQDGEIVGVNGLIVTTSQRLTFVDGLTYTAFLQLSDGSVESFPVTSGGTPNTMVLATAPSLPLVSDPGSFARTTYILVSNSTTPNMIANGGFEQGLVGWTTSQGTPFLDTSVFKDGTQSLRCNGVAIDYQTIPLYANHIYLAQAWVKTDGSVVGNGSIGAALNMYDPDSVTRELAVSGGVAVNAGNTNNAVVLEASSATDWTLIQITFRVTIDTSNVIIAVTDDYGATVTHANAWFDGVALYDITASMHSLPFLITQKEPQERNTYKLTAINYSDEYYSHDQDYNNAVVAAPYVGYGPQGYTGSGNVKIDGTTAAPGSGTGYGGGSQPGDPPITNPPVSSTPAVPEPTGFTIEDDTTTVITLADGTTVPRMLVSWDAIADDQVLDGGSIQVRYQYETDTTGPGGVGLPVEPLILRPILQLDNSYLSAWTDAGSVSGQSTYMFIEGITPEQYTVISVQIRAVRPSGLASAWVGIIKHRLLITRPVFPISINGNGPRFVFNDSLQDLANLEPAQAGADVTSKNNAAGTTGHIVMMRASDYTTACPFNSATVDDSANGASLGKVITFTSGWSAQSDIGLAQGFLAGSYDVYVRIRSDGQGSSPTSLNCGFYNASKAHNQQPASLNGLTTSYQTIYYGRIVLAPDELSPTTDWRTYFSSAGVTTNYYIDYIQFVPTVSLEYNVADGTTRFAAGEAGADVTGQHTAADTTAVNGIAAERMTALAVEAGSTTQNMIINGGFENGLIDWTITQGTGVIDTSVFKSGSQSLKLHAAGANYQTISLKSGHIYLAQVWVKTDGNVTGNGSLGAALNVYDPNKVTVTVAVAGGTAVNLAGTNNAVVLEATAATDWTLIQICFRVTVDTSSVVIALTDDYGANTATANAWFDGVALYDVSTNGNLAYVNQANTANIVVGAVNSQVSFSSSAVVGVSAGVETQIASAAADGASGFAIVRGSAVLSMNVTGGPFVNGGHANLYRGGTLLAQVPIEVGNTTGYYTFYIETVDAAPDPNNPYTLKLIAGVSQGYSAESVVLTVDHRKV